MELNETNFNGYKPKRAELGKMVPEAELSKRLAYELQVPIEYGDRLMKAYKAIIEDALEHGEGMHLGVATLRCTEHKSRTYTKGYSKGKLRRKMYDFTLTTNPHGDSVLESMTKQNFEDYDGKL